MFLGGCEKLAPNKPEEVVDSGDFEAPDGWTLVFASDDYKITAKNASSHFEYEHWVRTSSTPENWGDDCYLYGSADDWIVQPTSPANNWFRVRKSYSGLQKWNFCGGTQGEKWPDEELMKHWASKLYLWDTHAYDQFGDSYGGDLAAIFDGYNVRPVSYPELDAWYQAQQTTGTQFSVEVTDPVGLMKIQTGGTVFYTTNASLDSNNVRYIGHFLIDQRINAAVGNGLYFAVSDGVELYEFTIVIHMPDGTKKSFAPKYNANVQGSGPVCLVNIRLNGDIDQDGIYPTDSMYHFRYRVSSKAQDGNSRWNEINKALGKVQDDGTEWVSVNGNWRDVYFAHQMGDGSDPFFEIGIPSMPDSSFNISDTIGTLYYFSQFPIREWFNGSKLVRIEYDSQTGEIANAGDIPTNFVFRVRQNVEWEHTIWAKDQLQGVVLRDQDDYYEFMLTPVVNDTVWNWVLFPNDDGLREVYVKYAEYNQTTGLAPFTSEKHIERFDYNAPDPNVSKAWFGLTGDGEVIWNRGEYHFSTVIGGTP